MGAFRLPPLPSSGELLQLYKLRALKQLSQNFLLDPKLCSKLTEPSSGVTMNASVKECWELLAAVYRHGVNIEALSMALPHWSPEKLEHYIERFRTNGQRREEQKGAEMTCLTQWMRYIENIEVLQGTGTQVHRKGRLPKNYCPRSHGTLLSKVMLYLSQEEDHPIPSSPSKPDYSEIYRYLSQVLAGQEPSQLSQGSAAKVLEMVKRVEKVVEKSQHKGKLGHYLHLRPPPSVASSRKRGEPSTTTTTTTTESLRGSNDSDLEDCPLFHEAEDTEVMQHKWLQDMKALGEDDPYYEEKKNKILKKCEEKQAAMAFSLSDVPGFNPLDLLPHLLLKSEEATMDALLKC